MGVNSLYYGENDVIPKFSGGVPQITVPKVSRHLVIML